MDIDSHQLTIEYQAKFYGKVQKLAAKRAELCIPQKLMAEIIGKSLRTIQKFDNYECMDAFILFSYNNILYR